MSLFRDSWEVWRRKVNEALGGLVEPVKSEDVTYDNTDSGLTATNVQSAIDEVASSVDTVGDKLSALNGYMLPYSEIEAISFQADGVKTIGTYTNEMFAKLLEVVANLADDEYLLINKFGFSGYATLDTSVPSRYITKATPPTAAYFLAYGGSSTITVYTCSMNANASTFTRTTQNNATTTLTDFATVVPSSGTNVTLYYQKYKKI